MAFTSSNRQLSFDNAYMRKRNVRRRSSTYILFVVAVQIISITKRTTAFQTRSKSPTSFHSVTTTPTRNHHHLLSTNTNYSHLKPVVLHRFNSMNNNNSEDSSDDENKEGKHDGPKGDSNESTKNMDETQEQHLKRIEQLESIVASQVIEIRKLKQDCSELKKVATAFTQVVELLRQAGLSPDTIAPPDTESSTSEKQSSSSESSRTKGNASNTGEGSEKNDETKDYDLEQKEIVEGIREMKYFEDEIFGSAPASVTDAADAAGASILSALLAGKQRMLVDVRDAELSRDPEVLVQFIELAILPVAAGLEGLYTQKNRVKIVFPTVSQLLQYRKTMALAAPEVVALSTLGFDPVEENDNLVVVVAPSPDDEEGLSKMNDFLSSKIEQPVVLLNHHMVPLQGPIEMYEQVYHLRLLSVQYMTGEVPPEEMGNKAENSIDSQLSMKDSSEVKESNKASEKKDNDDTSETKEDAALEAAMEHAHELAAHQGITRAMVIRAYPRPWHVFVDTSPDTDADFEVAATFDEFPSQEDVNFAIIECLEGSEREDELVAQQMQQALEAGQLNAVSEMLGSKTKIEIDKNAQLTQNEDENEEDDDSSDDEEDDYYNDWDPWETDSV